MAAADLSNHKGEPQGARGVAEISAAQEEGSGLAAMAHGRRVLRQEEALADHADDPHGEGDENRGLFEIH